MRTWIILSLILIYPTILFSDLFFLDGKSSIVSARANLIYTIPVNDSVSQMKVLLHKFYSFTNGVNKQLISAYHSRITPPPAKKRQYTDQYGNPVLELTFDKPDSEIRIESTFIFNTEVDIFPMKDHYSFPLTHSSIRHVADYLKDTPKTTKSNQIRQMALSLTKTAKTEFQAVLQIISWVRAHIQYSSKISNNNALKTFTLKRGSQDDILNLTLTMLRSVGIPCRFTYGLSINKSYIFESPNHNKKNKYYDNDRSGDQVFLLQGVKDKNIEIKYPKSLYRWIEVYFPNRDWVPVDPFSSYFFVPSNFVRQSAGLDSDTGKNVVIQFKNKKDLNLQFFVEINNEKSSLTLESFSHVGPGQFLFPSMEIADILSVKRQFSQKKTIIPNNVLTSGRHISVALAPLSLDFNNNWGQLDLKATPDAYYSQRLYVPDDIFLEEILIPLFRFNNSPRGLVWLEVYEAGKNNVTLGKLLAKSHVLKVEKMNNAGKYSWISFSFKNKYSRTFIKEGSAVFILKHRTAEIILWRGIFGNPFQYNNDTVRYPAHAQGLPTILYSDLCFQLIGTPIIKKRTP
ncbi:MAG: transglutaminase family protein [Spirochaetota bacterium]|nr:transglutaminase family protein [Spirochaetota bacterium]